MGAYLLILAIVVALVAVGFSRRTLRLPLLVDIIGFVGVLFSTLAMLAWLSQELGIAIDPYRLAPPEVPWYGWMFYAALTSAWYGGAAWALNALRSGSPATTDGTISHDALHPSQREV